MQIRPKKNQKHVLNKQSKWAKVSSFTLGRSRKSSENSIFAVIFKFFQLYFKTVFFNDVFFRDMEHPFSSEAIKTTLNCCLAPKPIKITSDYCLAPKQKPANSAPEAHLFQYLIFSYRIFYPNILWLPYNCSIDTKFYLKMAKMRLRLKLQFIQTLLWYISF